ncbi:MAG: TraR/DksA family transcriptional regulator [Xanthobacteraceae bacterium]
MSEDRRTMTTDESIVKALQARLADLTRRVGDIDSELRKPLSADFSEQAAELENQDALGAIENSELQEIRQIQVALKRIDEGTYGICANCGEPIDPKRLKALPTATRCIACAT